MTDAPKVDADFLIKERDADGKYKIVGRGWKKDGPYGPFVSLSLGPERKSYLLVTVDKNAQPSRPVPEKPKVEVPELEEDSIPF